MMPVGRMPGQENELEENMQYSQIINAYIETHQDELLEMLGRFCAIPSVAAGRSAANAPFGNPCRQVLNEALRTCEAYGFETLDDEGYAGHAQIGSGEELIGVMAHLDVVPAGDGWASDPFRLDIRGGKAYARGAVDNKGPAAATIYAMHVLKVAGVPLKRRIRVILGCNEENGMDDLEHYFAGQEMPLWGFTPDAEFPVINCEKHIFHARLTREVGEMGDVLYIQAGERFNVVPEKATAVIRREWTRDELDRITQYAQQNGIRIETGERSLTVYGVAAHASHPALWINAASHLLTLICSLGITGDGAGAEAMQYLCESVGFETDGRSLGMACADEESGPLTCNFGIFRYDTKNLTACFDMRCPVTVEPDVLRRNMRDAAERGGFEMSVDHFDEGILVSEDKELIKVLLETYEEETGKEAHVVSIGGGTYARQMRNRAVAFGPCFPGDVDMCHQRDEYIGVENLVSLCKMIAQALLKLAA